MLATRRQWENHGSQIKTRNQNGVISDARTSRKTDCSHQKSPPQPRSQCSVTSDYAMEITWDACVDSLLHSVAT